MNLRKQYVLSGAAITAEFKVDDVELSTDSPYACEIIIYIPSTLNVTPAEIDYRPTNGASIEDVTVCDEEDTNGSLKLIVDVAVEQNNQRSSVSLSHPDIQWFGVSIPSASSLKACHSALTEQPTGDDLDELLAEHYDYHRFRRYTRFLGDLHRTSSLEEYIEGADRVADAFPQVLDVFDHPAEFLAENLLEYGRTRPARSFDRVKEVADQYDEATALPSVSPEDVVEYAVCKRVSESRKTPPALSSLRSRFLDGEPWHEVLSKCGLVYAVSGFVGAGATEKGIEIARRSPPEYAGETYERKKKGAKEAQASDRAHRWAQIVPAAAARRESEFRFVLANATYWGAVSLTEDTRFLQASTFHDIAASLFQGTGVRLMERKSRARVSYTKGVEMLHREKYKQAVGEFDNTYDVAVSDSEPDLMFLRLKSIRHAVAGLLNEGRETGFGGIRDEVETYFERYPAAEEVKTDLEGLYEGVGSYLVGAREECLAAEASDRDEAVEHLEKAEEAFLEARARHDRSVIEEKLQG